MNSRWNSTEAYGPTTTSSFPFLSKGIMELPFTRNFTLLPLLISDSTHAKKHSFAIRFIPISI